MNNNEIILYQPDGSISLEVRVEDETVWLNRQQMALLFDRDVKTIGKHINNALKEELEHFSVVANFATTARDGKTYKVDYYNLDMILSVGYRVKSIRGIEFRRWANSLSHWRFLEGSGQEIVCVFQNGCSCGMAGTVMGYLSQSPPFAIIPFPRRPAAGAHSPHKSRGLGRFRWPAANGMVRTHSFPPHCILTSKKSEINFYPAKIWHNQKMHLFDCLWFSSDHHPAQPAGHPRLRYR